MKKTSRWLVNGALVLSSLVIAVGLLEGGIRLAHPLLSINLRQALFERATDEDLYRFEPGIGTMAQPNLKRGDIRINDTEKITIQTDHNGFRNMPKAARAKIAFLGDSFVWGFGVEAAETWVEQLGVLTHQATASYGETGFSSWQYAQVFERYVAPQKPRLVIWSFFANDLAPVAQQIESQSSSPFTEVVRSLRVWLDQNSLIYRLVKFIIQGAYLSDQQPVSYRDQNVDLVLFPLTHNILSPTQAEYASGLQELKAGLQTVEQGCQLPACQLVVILIPTKEMVYLPRVHKQFTPEQTKLVEGAFVTYQQLASYLNQSQIPYLDLTPDFQKAAALPEAPALYFRIDGHWSSLGHRVAAQSLAQFLGAKQLLPK